MKETFFWKKIPCPPGQIAIKKDESSRELCKKINVGHLREGDLEVEWDDGELKFFLSVRVLRMLEACEDVHYKSQAHTQELPIVPVLSYAETVAKFRGQA